MSRVEERVVRGFCQKPRMRVRQFGGRLKRVSRRRLVVFAAASAAVITLLIRVWMLLPFLILLWALLPYLFPRGHDAINITLEHRNFLSFIVTTNMVNLLYFLYSLFSLVLGDALEDQFE